MKTMYFNNKLKKMKHSVYSFNCYILIIKVFSIIKHTTKYSTDILSQNSETLHEVSFLVLDSRNWRFKWGKAAATSNQCPTESIKDSLKCGPMSCKLRGSPLADSLRGKLSAGTPLKTKAKIGVNNNYFLLILSLLHSYYWSFPCIQPVWTFHACVWCTLCLQTVHALSW